MKTEDISKLLSRYNVKIGGTFNSIVDLLNEYFYNEGQKLEYNDTEISLDLSNDKTMRVMKMHLDFKNDVPYLQVHFKNNDDQSFILLLPDKLENIEENFKIKQFALQNAKPIVSRRALERKVVKFIGDL